MRAAQVIKTISHDATKQIFIQELLSKGITEKDGISINDLDFYALRQLVTVARYRETNVENSESKWF